MAHPSLQPGTLRRAFLVAMLICCSASRAIAGGGSENIAIVVNSDSWASKTIANEYIRLRDIAPSHVIYLHDIPTLETISVDDFRERILKPVLGQLNNRALAPQIDYIVYSTDFPYAVDVRGDLDAAKLTLPRVITPTASLNGLTYLYQFVLAKSMNYLSLESNLYFKKSIRSKDIVAWTPAQRSEYAEAATLLQKKRNQDAEVLLRSTIDQHPQFVDGLYNYACCLALLNKPDQAMEMLTRASDAGWTDAQHTLADEDLTQLRQRADFKSLINVMKQPKVYETDATHAFSARDAWTPQGKPAPAGKGARYVLSTMLAYTSGRGTSVPDAIAQLRRSVQADGTHPRGTFYFMNNTDVRTTTRKWAFATAVERLRSMGLLATIETGKLPRGKRDIAGLMTGTANFDTARDNISILPGAICEHLTSFGGVMREKAGQTPLSRFIEAGAAGASGTVVEPFAIQAKFPDAMIQVHYAQGCSLAESFYQSVAGPYQLLIVGDPLCQPWATAPEVRVRGVKPRETVRGEIEIMPETTGRDAPSIASFDICVDGFLLKSCKPGGTVTFNTIDWSDGPHDIAVIAIVDNPIRTQGRKVVSVVVNNHDQHITLRRRGPETIKADQTIKLEATARGASSIRIEMNGIVFGQTTAERSLFEIDPAELGFGPIELYAVAEYDTPKAHALSEPVAFTIEPIIYTAVPTYQNRPLERGFSITPEGETRRYAQEMAPAQWLELADVQRGQSFEFDAFFDARQSDLHQFQIHTPHSVRVRIDGHEVYVADGTEDGGSRWHYIPAMLERGVHRLQITCAVSGAPRLDVRFGTSGTQRATGGVFLHPKK